MKKLLMALACLIICLINAAAQTNTLDAMLTNVNQSSVASGIIYERATPFANLYNYNGTFDTATLGYFEQAFSELYRASNQTHLMPYTSLRQLYTASNQTNVIDIGVINTQFSILNYNEANPYAGGLTLKTGFDTRATLYADLSDRTQRIKEQVKSQYGVSSTEYKLIKGLKV